jgi:selenocysteine lyase/cysteine desulfurase
MFRNQIQMQKHPLVWLDNASTTFKPDCVLKAVESITPMRPQTPTGATTIFASISTRRFWKPERLLASSSIATE